MALPSSPALQGGRSGEAMSAYKYRAVIGPCGTETILSSVPLSQGDVISVRGRDELWKIDRVKQIADDCYLNVQPFSFLLVEVE